MHIHIYIQYVAQTYGNPEKLFVFFLNWEVENSFPDERKVKKKTRKINKTIGNLPETKITQIILNI